MTNHFTYNYKGFISIYTMLIFIIYLSIISFYTTQYSLKLKTIHNINSYYDLKINQLFEKGVMLLNKNSPIILIGFMGTGKSTIGEYLS